MEERSVYSVQSDKPTTVSARPVSNITPEQSLEILQAAVLHCQHTGISAKIGPFHDKGTQSVVIVLAGVQIVDGRLVVV